MNGGAKVTFSDMEAKAIFGLFSAMVGSVATAIVFLWKIDSHIESKIQKEMEPLRALVERIEKDLDSKHKWLVEQSQASAEMSKVASNLTLMIEDIRGDLSELKQKVEKVN